jgi:C-terminal processing protease CtpA/Prc
MKSNLMNSLLLGAAAAALILGTPALGLKTAQAQAPTIENAKSIIPAELQQVMDNLPPAFTRILKAMPVEDQVNALHGIQLHLTSIQVPSDPAELVKSLSSKAQDALSKLSADELDKALPEIQERIRQYFKREDWQRMLISMPLSQHQQAVTSLMSSIAFDQADAKFNYCNVLLDAEGEIAYSEEGIKRLAATPHQCPSGVDLAATLEYVNQTLACAIGDPVYTKILSPAEQEDMHQLQHGTKAAFKGGGIGVTLSSDPTKTLPPTAEQMAEFNNFLKDRQNRIDNPVIDPCTGQPAELTPEEQTELNTTPEQPFQEQFTGLINHVAKDSPAHKAGLRDGDVIVKLNGEIITGQPSESVVSRMRGEIGSPVTLTVKRGQREITTTMTRAAVIPENVWSEDLGNGIYAIVITDFIHNNTAFKIYDEINKIGGKARGYVFDVRNNGGGLLDEAILAVAFFVHDGVILSQRVRVSGDPAHPEYIKNTWSRVGSHVVKETVNETTGEVIGKGFVEFSETDNQTGKVLRQFENVPFLGGKPAVVLANGHSASAAEVFTGGLGENYVGAKQGGKPQGATFIGEQTFGKFIGQTIVPGPANTGIKATTFRYFSPLGEWLGDAWKVKIGLTPAIKFEQPKTAIPYTPSDVQLHEAVRYILSGATSQTAPKQ